MNEQLPQRLIALLLIAATVIIYPPPCTVAPMASPTNGIDYAYIVRPDPHWTAADVYATVPVSATNAISSTTIDLRMPWPIRWPPHQATLHASVPYTVYTCRAGARPSVIYLALTAR